MVKECPKCKTYKDCIGKAWYDYSDIRFCPYQVIWIIENTATLAVGNWPDNPLGLGHIDPDIKTGFRNEAYYVKAIGIVAEVDIRIAIKWPAYTGEAGEALVDEIEDGTVTVTEKDGKIKFDGLSRPAIRVLMYAKGKKRKEKTYPEWKAAKKYREKGTDISLSGRA